MDELFLGTEQYFLRRLQVANWGTFSGIHTVEISERGHLFVGGSGSGKSTLLDAISVLLTPGHINFNAAARQGERRSDRSFMSYVRGAWSSEQDSDGKAATKYLRSGSTWSAVLLTYRSNLGGMLNLMFIGYVRGSSREEAALRKNYFVVPAEFDLQSIADFADADFNVRLVKKRAPSSELFSSFKTYFECFGQYFGISDDKVLNLLHKAQSAKNMGDVNLFFREFMLEVPGTYEIAQSLVAEFTDLRQAYDTVKKTREQVDVLEQAQSAFSLMQHAAGEEHRFGLLAASVEQWKSARLCELLSRSLPELEHKLELVRTRIGETDGRLRALSERRDSLKEEHYKSGGEMIERLEQQLGTAHADRERAEKRRKAIQADIDLLGLKLPQTAQQFLKMTGSLRDERDRLAEQKVELDRQHDAATVEKAELEKEFVRLRKEIEAMRRQPSNIRSDLLEMRDGIAAELDLPPSELPFAGELMQILEGQQRWQGACERVLRPLSLSVLVPDAHYARFARAVNRRNLGLRLVYNRVTRVKGSPAAFSASSVPGKFELKSGPLRLWLANELAERFNYECVEDTAQFAAFDRAVTVSGQIKHNTVRHEKDDRRAVSDRKAWSTGFGNAEKRRLFEEEARGVASRISSSNTALEKGEEQSRGLARRLESVIRILGQSWEDIDTATLAERIRDLTARMEEIKKSDKRLQELSGQIAATEAQLAQVRAEQKDLIERRTKLEYRTEDVKGKLEQAAEVLRQTPLEADTLRELDGFDCENHAQNALTENNLSARAAGLGQRMNNARLKFAEQKHEQTAAMNARFVEFRHRWPAESSELGEGEQYAEEYFARLSSLKTDGLPKYEARFRDLLENHARQNLIDLVRELDNERRQIKTRMKEVNDSLAEVAFNRGEDGQTHLRIAVRDRQLPEVKEFKELQIEVMKESSDVRGQAAAEKYFEKLSELIAKLNTDNPQGRAWREKVLDVREHVTFQGIEFDDAGRTIEVFDSGAGKSGGQRQKLTMTCLVAALRYQLGGTRAVKPKYAPVVMDEAFDKADSEFTDLSMRIFLDFGFQPVIATPEKALYTLEPYVGSFSYVSCEQRKHSSILSMTPERVGAMLSGGEPDDSRNAEPS